MLEIMSGATLTLLIIFGAVMLREPRSLWSGVLCFLLVLVLAVFSVVIAAVYSSWLSKHEIVVWLLLALTLIAGLLVLAFPLFLLVMFIVEGVKIVRREGLSPSNLLSLIFAALWFGFIFIWPVVGTMQQGTLGLILYVIVSFSAVYMLALMAMFVLSALLNLTHLGRRRRLDYIVVLGAGLDGSRITPLLAARIDRGIQLLRYNPKARLILSGGQGPGEDLPEGEAMAAYAIERGVEPGRVIIERESVNTEENLRFSRRLMVGRRPRIAIVTTAYHVFRSLILAKHQGIRCIGFGARTKWYFTLNATLREFAGYLSLTRKKHIAVLGTFAVLMLILYGLTTI